jgi:hypothetical protein
MSAKQFYIPFPTAFNSNGLAVPGAKFYFYLPGTITLTTVYSDSGLTTPTSNPVVANGAGRISAIYLNDTLTYRLRITDSSGVLLDDIDGFIPGTFYSSAPLTVTVASVAGQSVSSRSLLANIVSPIEDQPAYLAEDGREGWFKFSTANLSAAVTSDPGQGVYVAPSTATSGASGAWVRVESHPLNVKWFGAVGDGVTNDQTAIQRAINYGFTLDAATLDFPIGVYLIGGSEDATSRGMLTLPFVASGAAKHIRFIGRGRPGTPAFDVPTNGVVLKSTVAGSFVDSAVITAGAYTVGGAFNHIYPHFENITIRTTDNPTRGGLQFSNALSLSLKNVNIDTGIAAGSVADPTNDRTAVWWPIVNNFALLTADCVFMSGYRYGYRISEHLRSVSSFIFRCKTAVRCDLGYHLNGGYLSIEHCPTMFDWQGTCPVAFDLDIERWDNPASGGAAVWYQSAGTDLREAAEAMAVGSLRHKMTIANVAGYTTLPLGANTSRTLLVQNLYRPRLAASVYASANQTLTNNTLTVVGFGSEAYDMIGGGDNTITSFHRTDTNTGRFTFDRAGLAKIEAHLVWDVNATGLRKLIFKKNGTTVLDADYRAAITGDNTFNHLTGQFEVVAGDYIEIIGMQTSGGSLDLVVASEIKSRALLEFIPNA